MVYNKTKPDGFKHASWVGQGERDVSGICQHCNKWDAELINGGCRDRECKDKRIDRMICAGKAMKVNTDLIGKSGKPITVIEHSGKRFLYERE
jgi:hypothetical protein